MKEEILKVISDNSMPKHFCEYGQGVFADVNAVDEIAESVVKLFSIHIVSQQRELLLGFQKSEYFDLYEQGVLEYKDAIEKYLA